MNKRRHLRKIKTELDGLRTLKALRERYPGLARTVLEKGGTEGEYDVHYSVHHSVRDDDEGGVRQPARQGLTCAGPEVCSSCALSRKTGGYCPGCDTEYFHRCLKHRCHLECRTCGGGRHEPVPACCGRSPNRAAWDGLFGLEVPPYAPDPLAIRCRLIPVLLPQVREYGIPEQVPEIDAWVVPVHVVMNLKGEFRSADIKDYLGLPKDRKLILSTSAPDTYMEMLWQRGDGIDYPAHGIDYWFPIHFSVYDNDSLYHQFANARRQQLSAIRSRSQFVWFRLGERIPVDFLSPIRRAPSVLISCQQMYSAFNRTVLEEEVRVADRWFPPSSAFFLIRHGIPLPLSPDRLTYEISGHWLMTGLVGRSVDNRPAVSMPVSEVLINNLRSMLERLESPRGR